MIFTAKTLHEVFPKTAFWWRLSVPFSGHSWVKLLTDQPKRQLQDENVNSCFCTRNAFYQLLYLGHSRTNDFERQKIRHFQVARCSFFFCLIPFPSKISWWRRRKKVREEKGLFFLVVTILSTLENEKKTRNSFKKIYEFW